MRIGIGYDVHRFGGETVSSITLGGVEVKHDRNVEAHSDGDVSLQHPQG